MKGQVRPVFFAVFIATLFPINAPAAQVTECSAAPSSKQQGYWFWRLIDGRKCWYVGTTMISKSLLRWPAVAPAKTAFNVTTPARVTEKHNAPLDAQARMPDDSNSFEALWRARVIDE